jgi:hypothetical protein
MNFPPLPPIQKLLQFPALSRLDDENRKKVIVFMVGVGIIAFLMFLGYMLQGDETETPVARPIDPASPILPAAAPQVKGGSKKTAGGSSQPMPIAGTWQETSHKLRAMEQGAAQFKVKIRHFVVGTKKKEAQAAKVAQVALVAQAEQPTAVPAAPNVPWSEVLQRLGQTEQRIAQWNPPESADTVPAAEPVAVKTIAVAIPPAVDIAPIIAAPVAAPVAAPPVADISWQPLLQQLAGMEQGLGRASHQAHPEPPPSLNAAEVAAETEAAPAEVAAAPEATAEAWQALYQRLREVEQGQQEALRRRDEQIEEPNNPVAN